MRALFLGLGGIGQRHLRNLRHLVPDCDIRAVRHSRRSFEIGNDLKADHAADIESKYRVGRLPDLAAAIDWRPDFAVVASPSALHLGQCRTLVEAGIPVFVEKPLATSRDGLDDFHRLAAACGVPVAVGYHLRRHPCFLRLREMLEQDAVGRVQSVEISVHTYMPSWHDYEEPGDFYAGVKALGGGVVLTEIHDIDLACLLFGRPRKVAAFGGARGGLGLDVEDTVSALMDFGDFACTLTLSFVQRPPMRRFVVNGARGRIVMDIPALSLVAHDERGREIERFERPDFDRNLMFVSELEEFLAGLGGGSPPASPLDYRDGLDAALAILDALDSGTSISLGGEESRS